MLADLDLQFVLTRNSRTFGGGVQCLKLPLSAPSLSPSFPEKTSQYNRYQSADIGAALWLAAVDMSHTASACSFEVKVNLG